jgi:hypothetical protein
MNAITRDLIRTMFARSLYVAAAFVAALVALILVGQAPERSAEDWILLASVLGLLALLAGVLATSVEMQEQ